MLHVCVSVCMCMSEGLRERERERERVRKGDARKNWINKQWGAGVYVRVLQSVQWPYTFLIHQDTPNCYDTAFTFRHVRTSKLTCLCNYTLLYDCDSTIVRAKSGALKRY